MLFYLHTITLFPELNTRCAALDTEYAPYCETYICVVYDKHNICEQLTRRSDNAI